MKDLVQGTVYLLEGFALIAKPGLRRYVILPFMINMLLFIALLMVLYHFVHIFNEWMITYLPTWLHWLHFIIWILFFLSYFVLFIYTFVTLANLVCAPFNSFLSEKVELYLNASVPESRTLMENIKDVPRIISRQIAILFYYLPRLLGLCILFFIPFLQLAAPFLLFLFHAWFMTLTYMDYPTDNHRIPLLNVRSWLDQQRLLSLSFGSAVLVATMIPIINFLAIPAAVAGATKFWVEKSSLSKGKNEDV